MKRLTAWLFVLLLALPTLSWAQNTIIYPSRTSMPFLDLDGRIKFSGGSTLTPGPSTLTLAGGQLLFPDGTSALPAWAYASQPDMGIWRSGSNAQTFADSSVNRLTLDSNSARIGSGTVFGWTATTDSTGAVDTVIGRDAAAIAQQGYDSATPVAQTYKGPDGSGANIAGGAMTFAPGRGTGTGVGGTLYLATAPAGGAGSSQNALVNQLSIDSTGAIIATGLAASVGEVTICATTTGLLVKRSAACVGTP